MRLRWHHLALGLAVLPFVAVSVAWVGVFNVGASSGHWKLTEWFLHFAMRSSVRTYAIALDVPEPLPGEAVQVAAAHFERGCAVCHGAPGEPRSPVALAMLPQPPDLAGVIDQWTDAQLFRIVKHGVRYTGMPAWPTMARDDEVWAMVAFLRGLRSMNPTAYRMLASGTEPSTPAYATGFDAVLAECTRCHEADGTGRSASTPQLGGQREIYLLESLRAYADGRRPSGIMQLPTRAVDPAHFPALARHFSTLPRISPPTRSEKDRAGRGEEIAHRGRPADKVPACSGCHKGDARNPAYPIIDGQPVPYIAAQLRLFRAGLRGGTRFSPLMQNAAKNLSDADIAAVSAYFSQLSGKD